MEVAVVVVTLRLVGGGRGATVIERIPVYVDTAMQ